MKNVFSWSILYMAAQIMLSCSGAQFDEDIPEDSTGNPSPVTEGPAEEIILTLNDLGYASTSNATLVVKEIDSYEGSVSQAYYLDGFLGLELPDRSIATSASTRILLDPDSLKIYVLYPNNNFTVLGWNGPKRQVTYDYEILGNDYYITPLRIDYSITDQQLSFKSISSNYTPCSGDGWGRSAEIIFDGLYDASINGYKGSFSWSEGVGENGLCKITCTGSMELLLDD